MKYPQFITTDFEKSLVNAIESNFSNSELIVCYFLRATYVLDENQKSLCISDFEVCKFM